MEVTMYRLRRLPIFLFIILIILVVALSVFGFITVRRSFPQTEGIIQLPGLDAQVEVYRDSFGIPHIYASTSHDLFMAQGFVHAQDRFWQMEFWRRAGAGRLSEILGESALGSDRFIRTVGWHRTAVLELDLLIPEERAILDAYAEESMLISELIRVALGWSSSCWVLPGLSMNRNPGHPSTLSPGLK